MVDVTVELAVSVSTEIVMFWLMSVTTVDEVAVPFQTGMVVDR